MPVFSYICMSQYFLPIPIFMKRILLLFVFLSLCRIVMAQNEPQALFVQNHYQSCTAPFSVSFKDTTWSPVKAKIVYWKWEFGDGAIDSSGPFVTHTYTQQGVFRAKLTVRDQYGQTDSYVGEDYSLVRIGPAFKLQKDTIICNLSYDQPFTLRNLGAPAYFDSIGTYQWYMNGSVWGIQRTTQTYAEGLYKLVYTACGTTFADSVYLGQGRPEYYTSYGKWEYDTIKYTFAIWKMPYKPAQYQQLRWDFGDGVQTIVPDTSRQYHIYTKPGTYYTSLNVRLKNWQDAQCDTAYRSDISVRNAFVKHNKWNGKDTIIGVNQALSLNANEDNNNPFATFKWAGDDPAFKATTSSITITKAGKYWVEIRYSGDVIVDTIKVRKDINWSLNTSKRYISPCSDTSVLSAYTDAPAGTYKIIWSSGAQSTQSDSIYTNKAGTYIAALHSLDGTLRNLDTVKFTPRPPLTVARVMPIIHPYPGLLTDTLIAIPTDWNGNYTYKWLLYNTVVGESNNPALVKPDLGYYRVQVTSKEGCTKISDYTWYAKDAAQNHIDFTWEKDACNTFGMYFHPIVTTPVPVTKYEWTFNDSIKSFISDPYLLFKEGNVNVNLKLIFATGDSASMGKGGFIRISNKVTFKIASRFNRCHDSLYISVNEAPRSATYSWNTGENTRNIVATKSGWYVVKVTDSCGLKSATDSVKVDIREPFARIELHKAPVAGKDTLIVTPRYTGNYEYYTWYRDGVKISEDGVPMFYNPTPGKYQVVVNRDSGCVITSDIFRYKIDTVSADFHYLAAPCDPQRIRFFADTAATGTVAGYYWNFGNNSTSTKANPEKIFAPGTYNVKLTIVNTSGDSGTITKQLVIPPYVNWTAKTQILSNTCGDTLLLTANSTPQAASVRWSTGDTTRSIVVTQSGIYTVRFLDSCQSTAVVDTNVITVHQPCHPVDTIEIGDGPVDSTKVLPVKATFTRDFNTGNIFTVQLTLRNLGGRQTGLAPEEVINLGTIPGTSGNVAMEVNIPDSLACATNYAVRVIASSPADTTAWSKEFTVNNQPPVPLITQRGDSLFTAGKYNWQWYVDNKPITGATTPVYRARVNGIYTVESLNGNGCVSKSAPVSVIITAIEDVTLGGNKVKAYPNPSEGQVYLQFEKPLLKPVIVNVYNMNGRVVYTRTTSQQQQHLDLSHLSKGFYLIELSGNGAKKTLSLILQ